MDTSHLRMGHLYGQTPPNIFTDFEWARRHNDDLLAHYGEGFLIIYQQQVVGSGQTYDEAVDDAERHLGSADNVITPIVYSLYPRRAVIRELPSTK